MFSFLDSNQMGILWYIVFIVCMVGYTVLDGFDLGVGMLHLSAKNDKERRIFLNSIGPVWDGNEVWLVIIIGALFAGFPLIYATLFSIFYAPMMVLIAALIMRAVSIEVRSKQPSLKWRKFWDFCFFLGSLSIAFSIGLLLGNLAQGIPLDQNYEFQGSMWQILTPYPILVGITGVALFTMHGSIYLVMKTEGALHNRLRKTVMRSIIFFVVCYVVTTLATFIYQPHLLESFLERPYLFIVALIGMLSIANVPREISKGNDGRAFLSSCCSIGLLVIVYAISAYPDIIRSTINPAYSLNAFNSKSSDLTLNALLTVVAIGVPLVLAYGFVVYRVFRGKVRLDDASY